MAFEILKENINNIYIHNSFFKPQFLVVPEIKILKICEHMKQKSDADNSDISFKKQHQKIHRNRIIRM